MQCSLFFRCNVEKKHIDRANSISRSLFIGGDLLGVKLLTNSKSSLQRAPTVRRPQKILSRITELSHPHKTVLHFGPMYFLQEYIGYWSYTRVGTLIVATIYLQLIQNRYMFRSFTVLHCSQQHCVQPVASDVEVVGYL